MKAKYYQNLTCMNDVHGNPRGLYVLYDVDGKIVRVIRKGSKRSPEECRGLLPIMSLKIPVWEYYRILLNTTGIESKPDHTIIGKI